jgi:hypothetical protein
MMTALSINPLEQPLILRSHRAGQWHCSHDQVVSNLLDCTPVCVKDSVELLSGSHWGESGGGGGAAPPPPHPLYSTQLKIAI